MSPSIFPIPSLLVFSYRVNTHNSSFNAIRDLFHVLFTSISVTGFVLFLTNFIYFSILYFKTLQKRLFK